MLPDFDQEIKYFLLFNGKSQLNKQRQLADGILNRRMNSGLYREYNSWDRDLERDNEKFLI